MEPDPPELVYDGDCPYCRAVGQMVDRLDVRNKFTVTDINSDRGRALVRNQHGRAVDSPHLFTEEYAYFGVVPVARATMARLPTAQLER